METKDKEIKANVLKDIFHGDQYLNILNEDDKEWLNSEVPSYLIKKDGRPTGLKIKI